MFLALLLGELADYHCEGWHLLLRKVHSKLDRDAEEPFQLKGSWLIFVFLCYRLLPQEAGIDLASRKQASLKSLRQSTGRSRNRTGKGFPELQD